MGGRQAFYSYFEITQLCKLLSAAIQQTGKWFCLEVGDLMGANIASLGKALVADLAFERFLAGVSPLVGLDRGVG